MMAILIQSRVYKAIDSVDNRPERRTNAKWKKKALSEVPLCLANVVLREFVKDTKSMWSDTGEFGVSLYGK